MLLNASAELLFCSLDLFLSHVFVAIVVVVCLSSLILGNGYLTTVYSFFLSALKAAGSNYGHHGD